MPNQPVKKQKPPPSYWLISLIKSWADTFSSPLNFHKSWATRNTTKSKLVYISKNITCGVRTWFLNLAPVSISSSLLVTRCSFMYTPYILGPIKFHFTFVFYKNEILLNQVIRRNPSIQNVYKSDHLFTIYELEKDARKSCTLVPLNAIAEAHRNKVLKKNHIISSKKHSQS